MKHLFEYFLKRSFIVNLVSLLILFIGLVSLLQMKRDLIPSFSSPQISISAYLNGASSLEVEKFLTVPLEATLKGFPDVEELSSVSSNAQSMITVKFKSSTKNIPEKIESIRSRISSIQSKLPQNLDPIQIVQSKNENFWLMYLGILNIEESNPSHRQWVKKIIQDIEKIHGMSVVYDDMRKYELHIHLNPEKLAHSGLSLTQIRGQILESLSVYPLGLIKNNQEKISIELPKKELDVELLKKIVLKSHTLGNNIQLSDLAEIKFELAERKKIALHNGESIIGLQLFKDADADVLTLKKEMGSFIEKMNKELPDPLNLKVIVDGPGFLEKQLDVLKNDAIVGVLLVILVLTFFLGKKTAFATAFGVPLSYFGTLIILNFFGIPLDLISIIAMLILTGILVDDAIIISERYVENLEAGMDKYQAALESVTSLFAPVTATITTTMVAFAPILFISGELRDLLFAIPVIMITALLVSWFETFFILPNHLIHYVTLKDTKKEPWVFTEIKKVYSKSLEKIIQYRYWATLASLLFILASIYIGTQKVKQTFSIRVGGERLTLVATLKKSASFDETLQKIAPLQNILNTFKSKPEIEGIGTVLGQVWLDGKYQEGYEYTRFNINISENASQPLKLKEEYKKFLTEEIKKIPQDDFQHLSVESELYGKEEDKKSMLSIFIYGDDSLSIFDIRDKIYKQLLPISDVVRIDIQQDQTQKSWQFEFQEDQLLKYGLSTASLGDQLRHWIHPIQLSFQRTQGEEIQIFTQIGTLKNPALSDIQNTFFYSPQSSFIPSTVLGEWKEKESLAYSNRKDGQNFFKVELKYNENTENFNSFKNKISKELQNIQKEFPQFTLSLEDVDSNSQKNKMWALKIFLICILLILFILALLLESILQPFLVALSIPFGVCGVLCALYLHGMDLGFMDIIGILGVAGVSVNNSLVMLDTIHKNSKQKKHPTIIEISQGAVSRLRAISITTLTTLVGVFPMAYGIGGDAGFTRPLAFSFAWGLLTSTVMTLYFLPAILVIQQDFSHYFRKIIQKFKMRKTNKTDSVDTTTPIRWSFLKRPRHTQGSDQKVDRDFS